jgi:molybdenum cofactor biosynthesis enzyme MoaA
MRKQPPEALIDDCPLSVRNFDAIQRQPAARYVHLRFDPIHTCNLHCVYCHNIRSDQIIETEALREFLQTKVLSVSFFQVGCGMEPTLDERLADIILMIANSPARPETAFVLQTNGLLLHRHDVQKMLAGGLTNLSVSLDTADPDMQRELRDGMSLRKVVRNVEQFRKAAPDIFLEFVCVVTSVNIGHIENLVDLALSIGGSRVIFREVLYSTANQIVDHARMPALLLKPGEFAAMSERIRQRFDGRIQLLFAGRSLLDQSRDQMREGSRLATGNIASGNSSPTT